ncbi:hypothetical protein RAC89_20805 [Paenibacillus sp. GD4]|uniref:hypothetical protein n=1 Tax=Paenibacillus sp. GD4 TaxID=3068890 RepID=UPI0027969CEB|nr:hypothetical protein [Paenibacillus sp. GD4]MDQ1912836.1 hypothetical protein [Paenibacillus sp. GD4]
MTIHNDKPDHPNAEKVSFLLTELESWLGETAAKEISERMLSMEVQHLIACRDALQCIHGHMLQAVEASDYTEGEGSPIHSASQERNYVQSAVQGL